MTEEVLQALVAHVASEEMTVFFSSHQIAEVDQIADHVAIIDRGRAVVAGALDDLRERYRRIQLVFDGDAPDVDVPRARRRARAAQGPRADACCRAPAPSGSSTRRARCNPVSVDVVPVTLKEIFLETVAGED